MSKHTSTILSILAMVLGAFSIFINYNNHHPVFASDLTPSNPVEVISYSEIEDGHGHEMQVRRIHDNESGAEILCFGRFPALVGATGYAMSCVPTGRKWTSGK